MMSSDYRRLIWNMHWRNWGYQCKRVTEQGEQEARSNHSGSIQHCKYAVDGGHLQLLLLAVSILHTVGLLPPGTCLFW